MTTFLTQKFTHATDSHTYTLHWTSLGEDTNPPLILIHGTPWSSYVWLPFAQSLSSRFKVYLLDNPGFGKSPSGVPRDGNPGALFDSSLAGQATAFAALYKSWSFAPDKLPHIVAHDVGGLISLRANLLHGCRYASLCLIDVVAVRPFGSAFFRLVGGNQSVFEEIPDAVYRGMLKAYIQGAAYKDLPEDVAGSLARPWIEGGTHGQKGFIRQVVQADEKHAEEVEGRYKEVGEAMPVKVVWGKEDRWIPADRAERIAGMIGAKEVVVIEEAGHLVMFDQPVKLAMEIALWLGDVAR